MITGNKKDDIWIYTYPYVIFLVILIYKLVKLLDILSFA